MLEQSFDNQRDKIRPSEGGTPTIELIPPIDTFYVEWYERFLSLVARQTGVPLTPVDAVNITSHAAAAIKASHARENFGPLYESPEYFRRAGERQREEDHAFERAGDRIEELRKNPPVYATNPQGWRICWTYDHNGLEAFSKLRIVDPQERIIVETSRCHCRGGDVGIEGHDGSRIEFGFVYKSHDLVREPGSRRDRKGPTVKLTKNGTIQTRRLGVLRPREIDLKHRVVQVIDSLPADFSRVE